MYELPIVGDVRGKGLMAGIECVINKDSKEALILDKAIGSRIDEESIKLGLIIRPLYHICVLSPALIITKSQIDDLVEKLFTAIQNSLQQLKTEGLQFFGLSGKYEDYDDHQDAYKVFSKSVESIKRKQVEQEFSNGKGDSKKKKFDFHGEMKKFSQEQKSIQNVPTPVETLQKVVPQPESIQMKVIEEAIADKPETGGQKDDKKDDKKDDQKDDQKGDV